MAVAAGWLQLLPLVFLLIYSLFSRAPSPVALLHPHRDYRDQLQTSAHSVPFYVRDIDAFESKYPEGGPHRVHLERQVRFLSLREALCICASSVVALLAILSEFGIACAAESIACLLQISPAIRTRG